jgi:1,5-anhydro-D-fructose reductase (1,5-anhydro-D-mannitol-forming)
MSQSIKWGLVGASGWSDHTFAPAILTASNAQLHSVVSSQSAHAESFCKKHGIHKGYSDFDAFLADDEVQAVYIASPSYLHAAQAISAMRVGKHVLCEKPMALNSAECRSMIDAAQQFNRLLSIGYMMRHHPVHRKIHADWAVGKFGKLVSAKAQFYFTYPGTPPDWRQKYATSGGWAINDVGTHLIDLLLWFLGDAVDVYGSLSTSSCGFETDDHALVVLRSSNDGIGVADASTGVSGPAPRLELYGTKGYCIVEGTFLGQGGTVTQSIEGESPITFDASDVNLYQRQIEAFGRSILSKEPLLVTANDGLENIDIISKARGY